MNLHTPLVHELHLVEFETRRPARTPFDWVKVGTTIGGAIVIALFFTGLFVAVHHAVVGIAYLVSRI